MTQPERWHTGLLRPLSRAEGRNPLGVGTTSQRLYQRALPGVTNATNRARYYTLYPAIVLMWWKERGEDGDWKDYRETLRRADCFLTLLTLSRTRDSKNLVGTKTLGPRVDDLEQGVLLSEHTILQGGEGSPRYFKNQLGGLGQYYAGPLRDLGVLARQSRMWLPTRELGTWLGGLVDTEGLLDVLDADLVTRETLERFSHLSLDEIPEVEAEALRELFYRDPSRRATLELLERHGVRNFDKLLYVAPGPSRIERLWATYVLHEFFSLALSALFWCVLHVNQEAGSPQVLAQTAIVGDPNLSVSEWLERLELAPLEETKHDAHEFVRCERMKSACAKGDADAALLEASELLGVLCLRLRNQSCVYETGEDGRRDLGALARTLEQERSWGEWIQEILVDWVILEHVLVTSQRLGDQLKDTMLLEPQEDGTLVPRHELAPQPSPSSPRLEQAHRILQEIGVIS